MMDQMSAILIYRFSTYLMRLKLVSSAVVYLSTARQQWPSQFNSVPRQVIDKKETVNYSQCEISIDVVYTRMTYMHDLDAGARALYIAGELGFISGLCDQAWCGVKYRFHTTEGMPFRTRKVSSRTH